MFAAFSPPPTQILFDPRVLYDVPSGRFLVTAESKDSGNSDQFQYFAVSRTPAVPRGLFTHHLEPGRDPVLTVGFWLMNGASILSTGAYASPGNDWHIVGGEHDRPAVPPGPC
jgi:hypothetical protein